MRERGSEEVREGRGRGGEGGRIEFVCCVQRSGVEWGGVGRRQGYDGRVRVLVLEQQGGRGQGYLPTWVCRAEQDGTKFTKSHKKKREREREGGRGREKKKKKGKTIIGD